jgi:hypothetical protein
MQTVVHGERVSPHYLVHAGTAEPLRLSPPEAVAYLLELAAKHDLLLIFMPKYRTLARRSGQKYRTLARNAVFRAENMGL